MIGARGLHSEIDDSSAAAVSLFPPPPLFDATASNSNNNNNENKHNNNNNSSDFGNEETHPSSVSYSLGDQMGGGGCRTPASQALPNTSADPFASPVPLRGGGGGGYRGASGAGGCDGSSMAEPPLMAIPATPAKQRRTVHHNAGPARLSAPSLNVAAAHVNSSRAFRPPVAKMRRGEVAAGATRKRSADPLSQFSAMDLEDSVSSPMSQQHLSVAHMLFPTQPSFTTQHMHTPTHYDPRGLSQLLVQPDAMELSQNDTEYSNIFARRILTDFREVRELGRGSFGKVVLMEESSTLELVAVKVSAPLNSAEQEHRYRRERTVMELAKNMPHVVQLSAWWEEGRIPQMYLQLEYCSGGSVAVLAERKRALREAWAESEVLVFTLHVAIALDALHRANIAHVDVKPDNVLVDAKGAYKLTDFGCSVVLDEAGRPRKNVGSNNANRNNRKEANGKGVGLTTAMVAEWSSPLRSNTDCGFMLDHTQASMASVDEGDCRYLCSDMLNSKQYFKAGDMYSLGMSIYELLSGEPLPRNGEAFLALRRRVPVDGLKARGYSDKLIQLVVALLQEDATLRPSAHDVLMAVRPAADVLTAVGDASMFSQWMDENCGGSQLRYVSAMMEATSWLLLTAQEDHRKATTACSSPGELHHPQQQQLLGPSASEVREQACTPTLTGGSYNWR